MDSLIVAKIMIERNSYQVHAFSDPQQALDHLKIQRCKDCDIVLSDIKMPHMTGIELAKYVKDDFPELKFIVMTSMPIIKGEWKTILPFSQNIDDFINKPFTQEEMIDLLSKYSKEQKKFNHH